MRRTIITWTLCLILSWTSASNYLQGMEEAGVLVDQLEWEGSSVESRIYNGERAIPIPFIVSIKVENSSQCFTHACVATRITEDQLLTAASCFGNGQSQSGNYRAVLGTTRNDGKGGVQVDFKLSDVTTHPRTLRVGVALCPRPHPVGKEMRRIYLRRWNSLTMDYDFAVVTLPLKLQDSRTVRMVKLAQIADSSRSKIVYSLGWGMYDCENYSDDLRFASGSPVSRSECERLWAKHVGFTPNFQSYHICALFSNSMGAGAGVDKGDLGGPLVLHSDGDLIQVGVLSYAFTGRRYDNSSRRCSRPQVPQVYSSPTGALDFIRDVAPEAQFVSLA